MTNKASERLPVRIAVFAFPVVESDVPITISYPENKPNLGQCQPFFPYFLDVRDALSWAGPDRYGEHGHAMRNGELWVDFHKMHCTYSHAQWLITGVYLAWEFPA